MLWGGRQFEVFSGLDRNILDELSLHHICPYDLLFLEFGKSSLFLNSRRSKATDGNHFGLYCISLSGRKHKTCTSSSLPLIWPHIFEVSVPNGVCTWVFFRSATLLFSLFWRWIVTERSWNNINSWKTVKFDGILLCHEFMVSCQRFFLERPIFFPVWL